MWKLIPVLSLCILLACCSEQAREQDEPTPADIKVSPDKKFSITDTLNKYATLDSVYQYYEEGETELVMGSANAVRYGFILKDDTLEFYEKQKDTWKLKNSSTFPGAFSYVEEMDVNGDELTDIKFASIFDVYGNVDPRVFLFNQEKNSFLYNHHYSLPNVEYLSDSNMIKSAVWSSVSHTRAKTLYKISGDSLIFYGGVMFVPSDSVSERAALEFFKLESGKTVVTQRIEGDSEKLWSDFEKALWDSR